MRGVHCDGRSARLRGDLPEPAPAPGEVVLAVTLAGICDTDLQLARGYMGFQGTLGHEFVARDDAGRRVTAEINAACHDCPTCLQGHPGHCPNRTVLGILGRDGAMADRVRVPARNVHPIPDAVGELDAAFVEPLAAAYRVVEQVNVDASTRVAVLGDGKLGLLCAWVLRAEGARVTLVGKHADKLALAGEGIETCELESAGGLGRPFDVVVDATGSPTGLATALGLVRPLGTVVLKTTVAGDHAVSLAPVVIDEVRVVGSRCGPFPRAIDALARRVVDVTPLIGGQYPLDDAESAFEAAGARGARKILLRI